MPLYLSHAADKLKYQTKQELLFTIFSIFCNQNYAASLLCTGKLRYLEFQGNGKNTSSFPKFEIANYDVTRIHVHEQKCVHFRLNRLSSFRRIGIATKPLYVCNPLCTALFTHKYRGKIMGGLVQPTKLLDHFLNGIAARKRHFRGAFSAH